MDIDELRKLSTPEIRDLYREHLEPFELSPNTIQTMCTDSLYLLRNDPGLDFWEMLKCLDYENIARERLKIVLQQKSKGDVNSNINFYLAQIRRFKNFVDGDIELQPTRIRSHKSRTIQNIKVNDRNLPKPSITEVEKYLLSWDELENYLLQEHALNKLFFELCPNNKDISDVLLKASALNDFYSTNIYSIFPVAKHIFNMDIDERLRAGDESLVDEMQNVVINGREMHFYSFSSKYCSHHNPEAYPIYDSYVDKVLCYFRNLDRFSDFKSSDLKEYTKFKQILIEFRAFYGLDRYGLKDIDKYIWQYGKEHFPNNYGQQK